MKKIYLVFRFFILLILLNGVPAQVLYSATSGAKGLAAGTTENASVTSTLVSDIGTWVAPETRFETKSSLAPVTNLQAVLTNPLTGDVYLSWECTPSAGFLNYVVKRNGDTIAVLPADTNYFDILPAYGIYTYCVEAVYTGGPATSVCVDTEWANPTMTWTPSALTKTVWTGTSAIVPFSIGNTGLGTLSFTFPDYVDSPGDSPLAYCAATAIACDEFIGRVQLGTIDQSSGCLLYTDYTATAVTDMQMQIPTPITITNGGNAYSSDAAYVWIDYDHNEVFDATELTTLTSVGGGTSFTGIITIPATAVPGLTRMRVRLSYNTAAYPCGSQNYGEVEDYSIHIQTPSFITQVSPVSGIIAHSAVTNVIATLTATGIYAATGVYTTTLTLNSNDPNNAVVNIPVTMIVGLDTYLSGVVSDTIAGVNLPGVTVQAGSYSAMTNDSGAYQIHLEPGTYNLVFSKLGYQTVNVIGVTLSAGDSTILNTQMSESPYAPACAYAEVNPEDTQCTVTWCLPAGPYELIYDDGTAESYTSWLMPGNSYAVKFTPQGYPATVNGARFYIAGGVSGTTGAPFIAEVRASDINGLPGVLLDSVAVTVTDFGWLTVNGLNAQVTGSDFFIVMKQVVPAPDCPELGIDETLPKVNRSYSKDVSSGGSWGISPYQDFIIRAIVSGPTGGDDKVLNQPGVLAKKDEVISLKKTGAVAGSQVIEAMATSPDETDNITSVVHYRIYRMSGFDPTMPPSTGIQTVLNDNLTITTYGDAGASWANLVQGWYAYAIEAIYSSGMVSEKVYTNAVPHGLFINDTVNTLLACGNAPSVGGTVHLNGLEYPYDQLTDTIPASGSVVFSNVIKGTYILTISYPGYNSYSINLTLTTNETQNITLYQDLFKPRNLFVDSTTLFATWETPLAILLDENFEGAYPPASWQNISQGLNGWYATTDGSSAGLPITPHTAYAVTNDELAGASNNGCCDYLITSELNLTGAPNYNLSFSGFYNGNNGEQATVEMSTDGGASWTILYTCAASAQWSLVDIDLTAYSGATGLAAVKFAFHANDGGNLASGWAVDDVMIASGNLAVQSYAVFQDNSLVANTPDLFWQFDPSTLNYGQSFSVCVAATYCSGTSEHECTTLTSHYLYPPLNLAVTDSVTTTSGAAILSWEPSQNSGSSITGYIIYNDNGWLAQVPGTSTEYRDLDLQPGNYCYNVSALYDLTAFGYPGQTGESVTAGPACTGIVYGFDLPFSEDFSSGVFDTLMWTVGQNWLIDSQSDNPVPAAKFKWDPILQNYSSALESHWINATTINNGYPYIIWFDYDVKLSDQAASSTEKLTVEVWDGSTWNIAKEYPDNGSFDWISEHLDITSLADNQVFKVRFMANGISSSEIEYWSVDNINIYTATSIPAPQNLDAELLTPEGNSIRLNWESPVGDVINISANGRITNALMKKGDQIDSLNLYNIYRRDLNKSAGNTRKTTTADFVKIASVDTTGYIDSDLSTYPAYCYEYYVTAVYDLGESTPSNSDIQCLYTGTAENKAFDVKLYPIPTATFLRVELGISCSNMIIYNSLGLIVMTKNITGETSILVNTSAYATGAYSVKFTAANGETFSRKFIVSK